MTTADIKARRERDADRLCSVLHTSRAYIFDMLISFAMDMPCLHPQNLERLLCKRGEMVDDESIRDCLERRYGKEIADLAESLI